MKSPHRCPACSNHLSVQIEDATIVIWCDVGRCPSTKANDGIKGYGSESLLAKKLIADLLHCPDWPKE